MKKVKLTGREINIWEHTGWGNSINWKDYKTGRMYGHLENRPAIGDIINSQMASGKIGQFIVVEVDYMQDPPDMFFCKVEGLGYKE